MIYRTLLLIYYHGPRFNRLAWGYVDPTRPRGVIAAGLENGELALWDPSKILAGGGYVRLHSPSPLYSPQPRPESLILRNTTHTGPVRGLDFNPIQTSLLASGGVSGEVCLPVLMPSQAQVHSGLRLGLKRPQQTLCTYAWLS